MGVQLEGKMKNIDGNIPASASQLQNISDRFKGDKIDKMVMASVKDADAMLFHIYATVAKENRKLTTQEHQQITDINSGKIRLLAIDVTSPIRRSLEHPSDPIIKKELEGAGVYEADGTKVDEFKSCEDAKANYPEGEIKMSNWFKKQSGFEDIEQKPIRYRVLIPVDIWSTSISAEVDHENVYNLLKEILDNGSQTVNHQGFNSLLQLSDIKEHSEIMGEYGIG